ncbi:MAG: toxic anion resistance protein [Lactobacillales bacterium]|nr:toxic anion resistance protein [Lactobacillales bacterium]
MQAIVATPTEAASPKLVDKLSPEDQAKAYEMANQINIDDNQSTITYGVDAQSKIANFSASVLAKINSKDAPMGDTLTELLYQLKEADPSQLSGGNPGFFAKFFGKVKKSIFETTAKYQKIGAQVDQIAVKLNQDKNWLIKDNQMLEGLFNENLDYFYNLNMYIAAAEIKVQELQNEIIPAAQAKAEQTGEQMDYQLVQDRQQFLERLEKRVYDLQLSRQISIQQAPQIRMIQNANQQLAEKLQTSVNTTLPLWKNQVVIALTVLRQQSAALTQRQVTETTNDLLTKNSEMLKQSTIETARENERGIVDIETLQTTQANLIETIEQTLQIQKEGRSKRVAAEAEMQVMEETLKNKLLEASRGANEPVNQ